MYISEPFQFESTPASARPSAFGTAAALSAIALLLLVLVLVALSGSISAQSIAKHQPPAHNQVIWRVSPGPGR